MAGLGDVEDWGAVEVMGGVAEVILGVAAEVRGVEVVEEGAEEEMVGTVVTVAAVEVRVDVAASPQEQMSHSGSPTQCHSSQHSGADP